LSRNIAQWAIISLSTPLINSQGGRILFSGQKSELPDIESSFDLLPIRATYPTNHRAPPLQTVPLQTVPHTESATELRFWAKN
jgi:hypothetical protein